MCGLDYAVVIVLGVFIFSALSWVISARKWFLGPVPNISPDDITQATLTSEKWLDGATKVAPHDKGHNDT